MNIQEEEAEGEMEIEEEEAQGVGQHEHEVFVLSRQTSRAMPVRPLCVGTQNSCLLQLQIRRPPSLVFAPLWALSLAAPHRA